MGCGKTTIGRWAGRKAGIPFLDLDEWIEEKGGRTIPEIFAQLGEAKFREIENQALKKVLEIEGDLIISCGGGTPCFFDNMDLMNAGGTTIYLQLSADTLVSRLSHAKKERPLLNGPEQIRKFVTETLDRRESFYLQAQVILEGKEASKPGFWNALLYYQHERSQ